MPNIKGINNMKGFSCGVPHRLRLLFIRYSVQQSGVSAHYAFYSAVQIIYRSISAMISDDMDFKKGVMLGGSTCYSYVLKGFTVTSAAQSYCCQGFLAL